MIRGKLRDNPMYACYPPPVQDVVAKRKKSEEKKHRNVLKDIGDPLYHRFCELYFNPVCKSRGYVRWSLLSTDEKEAIIDWLLKFKVTASATDLTKFPRNTVFLNQRRWERNNPLLDTGVRGKKLFKKKRPNKIKHDQNSCTHE